MIRVVFASAEGRERLGRGGLERLERLLDTPPDALGLGGRLHPLRKPGLRGRERWRWEWPDDDPTVLYIKRYARPTWREQWDRVWRQSRQHTRAGWEFLQSAEMARQYVPAVRAIAAVEERTGWWERRGAVIFERVAGDALDRVWQSLPAGAVIARGAARLDLTRRLARFVSAFHQTGACHRDLYLCHIFAVLDPAARQPPTFTLIDLARVHRPRWWRTRWLIKDLAELDSSARFIGASRTDRWRFLLTYLGLQRRAPRARWYGRRIGRKSDRILRRMKRPPAAGLASARRESAWSSGRPDMPRRPAEMLVR